MGIYLSGAGEEIANKASKAKLYTHYDQGDNGLYIGLEFDEMGDNETKLELKERIKGSIKESGIQDNPKVDILTDGWYEG
jgi:hypothetical protein